MVKAATLLREGEKLRRCVNYFVQHLKIQNTSGNHFDYEAEVTGCYKASDGLDHVIKFDFYRIREPRKNGFYMKEERTYFCTWVADIEVLTDLHKILSEAQTDDSKKYELDCVLKLLFGEDSRYANRVLRDIWVTCRKSAKIGVYFRTAAPSNTK